MVVLLQNRGAAHRLLLTGTVTVAVTWVVVIVIVLGLIVTPPPVMRAPLRMFRPTFWPSVAEAPGRIHCRAASKAALLAVCWSMLYLPNSNAANKNRNRIGAVKANSTAAAPVRSAPNQLRPV